MIRQLKRCLAVTLSFVLICLMANTTNSYAQTTDIGSENYVQATDENGNPKSGEYEYVPVSSVEYGTITVPAEVPEDVEGGPKRYILPVIGKEINVNTLILKAGANCTVSDGGILNASSLAAEDGATLTLAGNANIPVVGGNKILVYDSYWDDEAGSMQYIDITGDNEWMWKTFVYIESEGKWVAEEPYNPYYHEIVIEGFKNINDIKLTFLYSLDNINWSTLVNENVQQENEVFEYYNSGDTFIKFAFDYAPVVENIINNGGTYGGDVYIQLKVVEGSEIISYAFLEPIHHDVVSQATLSEDGKTFTYSQNETDENYSNVIFLGLAYPNEGDPKAKDLIENELFAYGDLDGDSDVDTDDIYGGFTSELCCRYFWEDGSILDGQFEITRPDDFAGRLEFGNEEGYTALDKDGNSVQLKKYPYVINLGVDHEGNPVKAEGYVYALRKATEILVFDGYQYYIRDLLTDGVEFINDDTTLCVSTDNFEVDKLKINGNGGGSYERMNPDDNSNIFTVSLNNEKFVRIYNDNYSNNLKNFRDAFGEESVCDKLRIIHNAEGNKYVALKKDDGEGEEYEVPGINTQSIDDICEAGEDRYTEVFVGDNILHIYPVAEGATGLTDTAITDVKVADPSMSDGVKITKVSDDNYKIEFLSNYYDEITLAITFEDGTSKDLEIRRIALVISYIYLMDGEDQLNLLHGNIESETVVNYDYEAGEQILVYATYYHPTDDNTVNGADNTSLYITYEDGETKVLNKYKYTEAKNGCVATSDYIIGLIPAKEKNPDNTWGEPLDSVSMPECNAIVVNGGFDNATTFGGTQLGSGSGVYWDGQINWNY